MVLHIFEVFPTNFLLLLKVFFCLFLMQVIELKLPSFFDNFDPRAAAANFPSSNKNFKALVHHLNTSLSCLAFVPSGNKIMASISCFHDLSGVQAYLAGLTFALAASPCSTPVLASLLGYVASTRVLT